MKDGIRWAARALAAIAVVFFGVMLSGHFFGGQETPPPPDILLSILVMLSGMVLAWKWEAIGGGLVIVGYFLNVIRSPQLFSSLPYAACLLTGVLFILSASLRLRRS